MAQLQTTGITGSLTVTSTVTATQFIGLVNSSTSASFASQALSASWAPDQTVTVNSASWASASISSSHSQTASWVSNLYPQVYQASGSWASASVSASHSEYAKIAKSASWASASISSSHAVSTSYATKTLYAELTTDPSGFVNRTDSRIHFDDATSTFSVFPAVSSFDVFINADKYTFTTTQSIVVSETKGESWYVFFDKNTKQLNTSSVEWTFGTGNAPVGIVYWDGLRSSVSDERHGISIDSATHAYFHETFGPRYASGLTGVFTGSAQRFYIESGDWYDDDLQNGPTASVNWCRVAYYSQSMVVLPTTTSYSNGKLAWNNVTTGVTSSLAANEYAAWWIYAVNGEDAEHFVSIMPQRVDSTLANTKANALPEALIFGNFPYREAKLLYRVIWRGNGTWQDTTDYRSAQYAGSTFTPTVHSSLSGLGADDHPQYLLLAGRGGQTVDDTLTVTGGIIGTSSWAESSLTASGLQQLASATVYGAGVIGSGRVVAMSGTNFVSSQIYDNSINIGIGIGAGNDRLTVNGNINATAITASLVGNADTATSASFASQALSASWAPDQTVTVNSASWSSASFSATSASFALQALSASWAPDIEFATASYASASNFSISSSWASASITATSASYAPFTQTYQASGSWASASISASYSNVAFSASYAPQATVTHVLSASWSSASFNATSASFASQALSASWAPGAIPARATFTDITASSAILIGPGADGTAFLYISASSQTPNIIEVDRYDGLEIFYISPTGSIAMGNSSFNIVPETLDIQCVNSGSYNAVTIAGSVNNYLQLNITNSLAGPTSSADLVATSDKGTEALGYIDMGINCSGYSENQFNTIGALDGYIYTVGSGSVGGDLLVATLNSNGGIIFNVGGAQLINEKMRIDTSSIRTYLPVQSTGYQVNTGSWVTRNGSYTIDNTDDGKIVTVSSGSAVSVTVTTSSINNGFSSMYYQSNTGRINFLTASTAVFLRNRANQTGSGGQYAMISLVRVSSTDFVLMGDTA